MRLAHPQVVEERHDLPRQVGHAVAKAQLPPDVEGDGLEVPSEGRDLLEPPPPAEAEPVYEQQRRALALDVVVYAGVLRDQYRHVATSNFSGTLIATLPPGGALDRPALRGVVPQALRVPEGVEHVLGHLIERAPGVDGPQQAPLLVALLEQRVLPAVGAEAPPEHPLGVVLPPLERAGVEPLGLRRRVVGKVVDKVRGPAMHPAAEDPLHQLVVRRPFERDYVVQRPRAVLP